MALSLSTTAYAAIITGGLALFALVHPAAEAQPAPAKPSAVTAGGFTLTSTSVALPDSERQFPPGAGMDLAQQNCSGCHSVGMVMTQPNLSKTAWEGEVNKMRAVYKAPVDAADVPAIVAYLASIKGAS